MAVVVDAGQPVGEMLAALRELAGDLLQVLTVFDVYAGPPIPAGKKSVALPSASRVTAPSPMRRSMPLWSAVCRA